MTRRREKETPETVKVRLGDRVDMKLHTITTIGLQTTITATTSLDRGRKRRKKRRRKRRMGRDRGADDIGSRDKGKDRKRIVVWGDETCIESLVEKSVEE